MTIQAEFEIPIARSVQAVWDELIAVERYPEWLRASGVLRVERHPAHSLGPGAPLRIHQQIAGRPPAVLEGAVAAWEPGRRFAFRARHPDGITIETDAQLAQDGPGCRLRWSLRIGLPLKFRLFEGMAAPEVRQAASTDLLGLKRRLESVAG